MCVPSFPLLCDPHTPERGGSSHSQTPPVAQRGRPPHPHQHLQRLHTAWDHILHTHTHRSTHIGMEQTCISHNLYSLNINMCVSLIHILDNEDDAWCTTNFLNPAALRLAVVIRAELLEVMHRIELPVSPPSFGCQDNCTNIKRALISGFFLKVKRLISSLLHWRLVC